MKKFRFMLLALAATFCIALASCEKEETETNEPNGTEENGGRNQNGNQTGDDFNIQENGNTMTVSFSYKDDEMGNVDVLFTFTFDNNGKCSKAIAEITFPSEELARAAYAEIQNDPEEDASLYRLEGRKIISDGTEIFKGMTKTEVKAQLEMLKKMLELGDDDNNEGDSKPVINETATQISVTYTVTTPIAMKIAYVFDMENGLCVKATSTMTFESAAMAQMVFAQMGTELGATLNGNTISMDMGDDYVGMTRDEIMEAIALLTGEGGDPWGGDEDDPQGGDGDENGDGDEDYGVLPNSVAMWSGDISEGQNISGTARLALVPIANSISGEGESRTIKYTFELVLQLHNYDTDETFNDAYTGTAVMFPSNGEGYIAEIARAAGRFAEEKGLIMFGLQLDGDNVMIDAEYPNDTKYTYTLTKYEID